LENCQNLNSGGGRRGRYRFEQEKGQKVMPESQINGEQHSPFFSVEYRRERIGTYSCVHFSIERRGTGVRINSKS